MKLNGICSALQSGCTLHSFRSGGGLRVVRLEKGGKLKGYGEHPQIEDALSHADDDFLAGGRPYDEVYGGKGNKPHYLTGSLSSTSDLDQWILQGHTFDAKQDGDVVLVELKGLIIARTPNDIVKRVERTKKPETYESRGYTIRVSPFRFPGNGEEGVSSEIIKYPEGKNSNDSSFWIYDIVKTGRDKDLSKAIELALRDAGK